MEVLVAGSDLIPGPVPWKRFHSEKAPLRACQPVKGQSHYAAQTLRPYDPENTPLSQFIRQEVPYRLVKILEIPPEKITPLVIRECVDLLERSADGLFRYDKIEMLLLEVLKSHGLWEGDM